MSDNDLKLFEAVAFHESFTKAAEEMFTVQSNVTARIKKLEEEFGAALFTRTSRNVKLTNGGETLLRYSKQINRLIEEAKERLGEKETVKGLIKVGFLETMLVVKGPELVNELASRYPFVDLEFKSAMKDVLVNDVLNYRLDAAFVPAPLNHLDLAQIWVKEEEIVAVGPDDCAGLNGILSQTPLKAIVFDQDCVFRSRLENWLVFNGISNYHKTVMNSIEGVINFIESGIGFSFLPGEIVSTFYRNRKIRTFPLPKEFGMMKTYLIYRNDIPRSTALTAFADIASATMNAEPM
ncbi:LysR family transcriptional regulator [Parapedobacter deserti]|uniref:LysR family transcriptional regulator n=1 Tax=Parapedobacter deserti TaxID=1912957 RepID=A0ABV7JJC4_9SPHI